MGLTQGHNAVPAVRLGPLEDLESSTLPLSQTALPLGKETMTLKTGSMSSIYHKFSHH